MDSNNTKLNKSDYSFLERFLDATKSNLFFAEGVLLVEGDAENILLPSLARIIGKDLIDYGVSIVNVGHTGLFRYSRIFLRDDPEKGLVRVPVACIKDNDVSYFNSETKQLKTVLPTQSEIEISRETKIAEDTSQNVHSFVSPNSTLEFDISLDAVLRKDFYRAVLYAEKARSAREHIFINETKKTEANTQVEADFLEWERKNLSKEQIALNIYLKCRKNKSITAQFFAEYIDSQNSSVTLKEYLIGEQTKLKYIIDAIKYVTSPIVEPEDTEMAE
jgi:putative ATP-dependent endonuclease of the OLD family